MAMQQLTFEYKNWRGEVSVRSVSPRRLWVGSTEYHPDRQWFLHAYDHGKGQLRDFALADCVFDRALEV